MDRSKSYPIWTVAQAKARLSEILRLAEKEGPQRIGARKAFIVVPERTWQTQTSHRKPIGISRQEIANLLDVDQSAVARMESRADIRIQSLRQMIEAMGGTLEIIARFDRGEVRITNYTDPDNTT